MITGAHTIPLVVRYIFARVLADQSLELLTQCDAVLPHRGGELTLEFDEIRH